MKQYCKVNKLYAFLCNLVSENNGCLPFSFFLPLLFFSLFVAQNLFFHPLTMKEREVFSF